MSTEYGQICDTSEVVTEAPWTASDNPSMHAAIFSRYPSWRSFLSLSTALNAFILLVTVALIFVAAFAFPRHDMLSTLSSGSCSQSRSLNIWLRVLINGLCTALLAANCCAMRCLIAPTRAEIDEAHRKGDYMDVGIASWKNFKNVAPRRRILLILAMLSSLPIHLLANSAVFETIGTDSYLLVTAYQPWVNNLVSETGNSTNIAGQRVYNITRFNPDSPPTAKGQTTKATNDNVQLDGSLAAQLKTLLPKMERLDNKRCIEYYSKPLITGRRHVVAVSGSVPQITGNQSFNSVNNVWYQSLDGCPACQPNIAWTDPSAWTCAFALDMRSNPAQECDSSAAAARADDFRIDGLPISYCLSEEIEEKCQLQADIGILCAIMVCALVKLCILSLAMHEIPNGVLITLGDAVASFLTQPDSMTVGCSLLSYEDVQGVGRLSKVFEDDNQISKFKGVSWLGQSRASSSSKWTPGRPFPKRWSAASLRPRYMQALPKGYLASQTSVFSALLVLAVAFLAKEVVKMKSGIASQGSINDHRKALVAPSSSIPALWRLGFGAINENFLVQLRDSSSFAYNSTLRHILIINSPQIMVVLCYYGYYNMWTNMLLSREWASLCLRRQGLRVSQPRSIHQRRSIFLTLPLVYTIPLHAMSTLLHWLLSESLFLARVKVYSGEPFTHYPASIINTVGYSPIALFFFIMTCVFLLVILYLAGTIYKLRSAMPVVGSCSLAISAACHPPACERDQDIALKEVMWGVVPVEIDETNAHVEGIEERDMEFRHCSFSTQEVVSPETLPLRKSAGSNAAETVALFR